MSENAKQPDLPKGLIGRRGAPSGKAARLPSLRGPRDLTLGGVPKKVFTPNIPARRDKSKDEHTTEKSSKQASAFVRNKVDRGRGRGRGRGRENTLVQSHSIFEQGPAQKQPAQRGNTSYREEGERSHSSKISVKKEKTCSTKDLDALLRDDFIDDGDDDESDMPPVILPLAVTTKADVKIEIKADVKSDVKSETVNCDMEGDSRSSEDVVMLNDEKSTAAISPKKSALRKEVPVIENISCLDIFTKLEKTEEGELIFLQLPDTLPGLPPRRQEEVKQIKSKSEVTNESNKKEDLKKTDTDNLPDQLSTCSLSDFSEGFIGKLQIRKSGKAELLLGNVKLDVTVGTPSGFLQEVVSVKTTGSCGHMNVLGHVKHRLICTPNFESLLHNS